MSDTRVLDNDCGICGGDVWSCKCAASPSEVEGVETPGNLSFDTLCIHGIPLMVACTKCADAEITRLRADNERLFANLRAALTSLEESTNG